MRWSSFIVSVMLTCRLASAADSPDRGANPSVQPVRVTVSVDPKNVLSKISEDFIGFGYETSAVARPGYFSPKNFQLVQFYRTLTDRGLVRIGGIIGDHTRYEPNGTPSAQAQDGTTVINSAVLQDLGDFLRATGWKALWTLNLGTGSKEEAAEQAVAVHHALGDRLHSFEIGNEVDLLKRFDSFDAYHAAYLEYKAAVRKVLPQAVFSGADVARKVEWNTAFAAAESKDMKLLLQHYYRTGAKAPDATIESLLRPHADWDTKLETLQQICQRHQLSFRINEVNSFFGGGKAGVSDTFASALWCLDYMYRVASHGGVGVNMETDVNQIGFISHYSPIFRDEHNQLSARPEYYGMLAFAQSGKGKLIAASIAKTDLNLSAYATAADDGSVWLTLLNRDQARPAVLNLDGLGSARSGELLRLSAPAADSKTDVTLGGAAVGTDGAWRAKQRESVPVADGKATVTLPAVSAVVIQFR